MSTDLQIEKQEPKVYEIVAQMHYKLDISTEKYTCNYNNDLSNQMAAFILVKNVIDKLLSDRKGDKAFKKDRASFQKMSYQLEEIVSGMGSVLLERVIAQEEKDVVRETADKLDIKIVKG
jgi:hypothetical protein